MCVAYFLFMSLVITVQAQNCPKPVAGPNMNLKGNDILLETFPDGTKVSFACDVGYIPAGGSSSITCTAGNWSPVNLKCARKNCGSAGEVTNGQIDYPEGTEFGDKAVITCDTDYRMVGKSEIICGDQGWSGRLPECEVVTCDPPPVIVNGDFSPNYEEYSYRDVVQYSCNKDYTLSGSKSLTCSEDGTFRPDPPTCVMIQCENPDVDHGVWAGGSRPPYRFSSTVTLVCSSGYSMKGEGTQTCDINGKWSPGLPTCERKNCGSAGEMTYGRIDYAEGTEFGATAVITCDTGYKLKFKSESEIKCEDKGWSGTLPVCEETAVSESYWDWLWGFLELFE